MVVRKEAARSARQSNGLGTRVIGACFGLLAFLFLAFLNCGGGAYFEATAASRLERPKKATTRPRRRSTLRADLFSR